MSIHCENRPGAADRSDVVQKFHITAVVCLSLTAAIAGRSGAAPSGETPEVRPPGPAAPRPTAVKLAVFDFEMEDVSPAASLLGQSTNNEATMEKVSSEARRMLERSGRFILVDMSNIDAEPVKAKSLRNCNGCEAGIASQAGAEQALLGVVRRVTQTDYYVLVRISDAHTGKVLNQQDANFAGGPDGWASGVRMLLKHQVLAPTDEP
jgi:hypothetical protein